MRIGIDGGCWLNRRGYGRYTRSLLRALAREAAGDEIVLFADPETARAPDLPRGVEIATVSVSAAPAQAAASAGRRSLGDLARMSAAVARRRLDVFFFPSAYTFFPLIRPVPSVVAVHDVIAERLPHLVFPHRRFARLWNLKLAVAIRQARTILTVSEDARRGILERWRLAPGRVRVILEAADPVFCPLPAPREAADILPGRGLPRGTRFVLYVGGLSPHKNLPVLVEAYARACASPGLDDVRLLLAGDEGGDVFTSAAAEVRALVARRGLGARVCFTGFVPDEALAQLYNRAALVVLPSLAEGFGLPALEAAACGTAVVVSRAGPMAEILGEGAAAFDPGNTGELAAILAALLADPERRRAMGEEGRRRASALTWPRAATELRALLGETARRPA